MKIELEDIKEFQRLWKEHFHTDLSEDEAQVKASFLLEMMKVIYQPIPKPASLEEESQLSILDYNPIDI